MFAGERRGTAIASTAMSNLLGRMGRLDITVHEFASAFRDWAAERTGYANHIVEMALARVDRTCVEQRHRWIGGARPTAGVRRLVHP